MKLTTNELNEFNTLRDAILRLLAKGPAEHFALQHGWFEGNLWTLDNLLCERDPIYWKSVDRAHSTTELRKLLKKYARGLHESGIVVSLDRSDLELHLVEKS